MEITKPIIHTGILKHDLGNIYYSEKFLKKLAESKGVGIELNKHNGENIGTVKSLEYKNNALYATMDIPDEYLAEEIAFSTDIVPNKYSKIDSMTFEPEDGYLNNVVYVNDGTPVRDTKTITFLNNLEDEDKGDNNMSNESELAKEYGALKSKYEALKKEKESLLNTIQTLEAEKSTLETDLQTKTQELETITTDLTKFREAEAKRKSEMIKRLVKDENDPLSKVYEKMELEDIELLVNEIPQSTPTKGVGTQVSEQDNDGNNSKDDKVFDYQAAKREMGLK